MIRPSGKVKKGGLDAVPRVLDKGIIGYPVGDRVTDILQLNRRRPRVHQLLALGGGLRQWGLGELAELFQVEGVLFVMEGLLVVAPPHREYGTFAADESCAVVAEAGQFAYRRETPEAHVPLAEPAKGHRERRFRVSLVPGIAKEEESLEIDQRRESRSVVTR